MEILRHRRLRQAAGRTLPETGGRIGVRRGKTRWTPLTARCGDPAACAEGFVASWSTAASSPRVGQQTNGTHVQQDEGGGFGNPV